VNAAEVETCCANGCNTPVAREFDRCQDHVVAVDSPDSGLRSWVWGGTGRPNESPTRAEYEARQRNEVEAKFAAMRPTPATVGFVAMLKKAKEMP
jgi:hypothetical protein